MTIRLLHGDNRVLLREMAERGEKVNMICTSPPYWALRDYGTPPLDWPEVSYSPMPGLPPITVPAMSAQLGLEDTVEAFIGHIVHTFRLAREVLRDDGVCFVNLGDSYCGNPNGLHQRVPDADAAWLAALIDGEGCIQIHRQQREGSVPSFQADVSVGQIDDGMVKRAHRITGMGYVNLREGRVWDWVVRGPDAALLLTRVFPFLVLKQRQAAAAIELVRHVQDMRFHRVRPVTNEAIAYREQLRASVQASNQRKPDDMHIPEPALLPPGNGLKPKDLVGQPWRVAFALQADGWWLRQDIIWSKLNPMPESIRDRFTKAHEYLFLLAKSERYAWDFEAMQEPVAGGAHARRAGNKVPHPEVPGLPEHNNRSGLIGYDARREAKRGGTGVGFGHGYDANPKPRATYKIPAGWAMGDGSHSAIANQQSEQHRKTAGPKEAAEGNDSAYGDGKSARMGRGAGWRERKLAEAGSGTKNNDSMDEALAVMPDTRNRRSVWPIASEPYSEAHFATFPRALVEPCIRAGCPLGGTVLDIFGGSGATALVADQLQRDAISMELKSEYVELQHRRIAADAPLFAQVQS